MSGFLMGLGALAAVLLVLGLLACGLAWLIDAATHWDSDLDEEGW